MSSILDQILQRLDLLERRIGRLEAAARPGRNAPEASNAEAFRGAGEQPAPRTEPAGREAVAAAALRTPLRETAAPGAAEPASVAAAPVTERLDRVPIAGDPFPDLSLLDEKVEPRKGPAQHVQVRAALEDYPRISGRVQQLWGTPDCEGYLNSLVIDTRGNRKGFPPEMMEELLYLGRLARALVILAVQGDVWSDYDQVGDRR